MAKRKAKKRAVKTKSNKMMRKDGMESKEMPMYKMKKKDRKRMMNPRS